jgi:phage recombination protein Bet
MSNELVTKEMNHAQYIDHNLAVIANQSKLNETDLAFFAIQCKRTGLDPITRQIYALPIGGKLTITASIDGLRLIAERSGKYEGQTPAMWCGDDGKWLDVWLDVKPPRACKVGVYKSGFREALYATALFNEYVTTSGPMWKKMPALMISKVAESLALRKAFPNEMSGIYSENELDQASQEQAKDVTEPKKHIVEKVADVKTANAQSKDLEFLSTYVVKVGKKFAGKMIGEIDPAELESYLFDYLEKGAKKSGKPLTGDFLEFFNNGSAYLKLFVNHDAAPPKLDEEEQLPF